TPLELDYGGDASLTSDSAEGSIDSPVGDVSWDLSYEPDDVTFTPLRSRRITDIAVALLGAGRHWSFNESVAMDGTLELGDETVELEGAPGHQGHTVGTNVPESWSWVHCNSFDDETAVLEALEIEGKLSVCFRHDGEVHMINRLHHVVGPLFNKSTANDVGEWRFLAKGDGVKLEAEVSVEPGKWRHAAYLTPDDTTRYVAHCSLADIRVKYQVKQGGDWSEPRVVESNAGRAEWSDVTPPAGDEDDYVPEEFVG
ncbi:MAG: hypothetical protein SV760_00715, partial [Halobacteria archaeon]|nr:hypothetical protein [Halobacteria archaeon]